MKLEKELKKNLGLNLWNKFLIIFLATLVPFVASAEPIIDDIPLPPGSFTFVDNESILKDLALTPGPAWCYDVHANAALITAPARARAHCELKLMYELEKQKTKQDLQINKLELRIKTLVDQYEEITSIKDGEIERLTEAALKRPNDYTHWWAIGGFASGTAITVLIGWLAISAGAGP